MRNRIRCRMCGDIIESKHVHDFVYCTCGSVAVDGGQEYHKRVGKLHLIEEIEDEEDL